MLTLLDEMVHNFNSVKAYLWKNTILLKAVSLLDLVYDIIQPPRYLTIIIITVLCLCSCFQNNVEIHVAHIQSGLSQLGNLHAFSANNTNTV